MPWRTNKNRPEDSSWSEDKAPKKLQRYQWRGRDQNGQPLDGALQAPSRALATYYLRQHGIQVQHCRRSRHSLPLFAQPFAMRWQQQRNTQPASREQITTFSAQLAELLDAGLSLTQSLETLLCSTAQEGRRENRLNTALQTLRRQLLAGQSLSAAMAEQPQHFDTLYCQLIACAEQSGTLPAALQQIALQRERQAAIKESIRRAARYPVTVFIIAVLISGALLINVIPQFAALFAQQGQALPAATRTVIAVSQWLQQYTLVALALSPAIYCALRSTLHRPSAVALAHRVLLALPLSGQVISASCLARATRTLATTLSAGLPLVDALEAAANSSGHAHYRTALQTLTRDIRSGLPLSTALANNRALPMRLRQLTAIGDSSATLQPLLERAAAQYESELERATERLTSLLEPTMMCVIGLFIGAVLLAIYLPVFQIGTAF